MEDKLPGSQQRILMTNWVGQAWKKIIGMKKSIIRCFKRCGLSVPLDGSDNAQVSIDEIPNYEMPQRFVEEEFKLLDNNEDEDEVASKNNENNKFDLLTDRRYH